MSKPRPRPSRLLLAALFTAFSMPLSAQSGPTPVPSPSPAARTSPPPGTKMSETIAKAKIRSTAAHDLLKREEDLRKALLQYCLHAVRLLPSEQLTARAEFIQRMDSLLSSLEASQEMIPETEWNALHFLLRQDDALLRHGPAAKNGAERQALAAETKFDQWAREELAKRKPEADDGPAVPEGKGSKAPPPTTPEPKPKPPTVPPPPAATKRAAAPAAAPARAKTRPAAPKPFLVSGAALIEKEIPEKELIAKQREPTEWVQRAAGGLPGESYEATRGSTEYYGKLFRLPGTGIVLRAHTVDQLHFLKDVKTRTRRIVSIADFDAHGDHVPARQIVEVFDAKDKLLKRVVYVHEPKAFSKGFAIETTPGAKGKPPRTRKRSISAAERKILLDPWKSPALSREPSMVFDVPGKSRLLAWYDPSGRHPRLLPDGSRLTPMAGSPVMLQIVGRGGAKQGWYVDLDPLLNASTPRERHALALKIAAQILPAIGITGQPRLVQALGDFLWDHGTPGASQTHLLLKIDPKNVFTLLRVNSVGNDSVVRGKFYVGSDFGDKHWGKVSFLAMRETDLDANYGFDNPAGADSLAYEYRGDGARLDWGAPEGKELIDKPHNETKAYFGDVGPDLNKWWDNKIERTRYTLKRQRYDEKKGAWLEDGQTAAYRAEHEKAGSSWLRRYTNIANIPTVGPWLGHGLDFFGKAGNFIYTWDSSALDITIMGVDKFFGNSTDLDELNVVATGSRNSLWTYEATGMRQPILFDAKGRATSDGLTWMRKILGLLTPGARKLLNEHVEKVLRPRWFEQAGLSPQTVGYEAKLNAPISVVETYMGLQDFGAGTRGRQIAEFGGGFWLTTASMVASGGEAAGQVACNPLTWILGLSDSALSEGVATARAAQLADGGRMLSTWQWTQRVFNAGVAAIATPFAGNAFVTLGQAAPQYDTPEGKARLGESLTNLAAAGFLIRTRVRAGRIAAEPPIEDLVPEPEGGSAPAEVEPSEESSPEPNAAPPQDVPEQPALLESEPARVPESDPEAAPAHNPETTPDSISESDGNPAASGGHTHVMAAIGEAAAGVKALLTTAIGKAAAGVKALLPNTIPALYLMSYPDWSDSAARGRERVPGYFVPDMTTVLKQFTQKSVPDNWILKGTVYDLMTLRPVPAVKLKFIGLKREGTPAKTDGHGKYKKEVPSMGTSGGYVAQIDQSGYLEQCLTKAQLPANFRSLSAEQRRKLLETITKNAQLNPNSDDEAVVQTDLYAIPEPKSPTAINPAGGPPPTPPAPPDNNKDQNDNPPPPGNGGGGPPPPNSRGHHRHPRHGGGGGGVINGGGGGAPPAGGHPGTSSAGGSSSGGGDGGGGGGAAGAPSAPNALNPDFDQAGESAPPPLNVSPSFPSKAARGGGAPAHGPATARRQAPRRAAGSAPAAEEAPLGGHGTPENLAETAGHPFDNREAGSETKAAPVKGAASAGLGLPHLPPLNVRNPFGTKKAGAPPESALAPAFAANGAAPAAGPSGAAPEEGEGVAYMEPPADQFQPLREKAPARKRDMSLPLDLGLRGAAFLAALYLLKYSELAYLVGLRRRPRLPPPSGNRDVA